MKNLELGNTNVLENKNFFLSKKSKKGAILAICLGLTFGSLYGIHLDSIQNDKQEEIDISTISSKDLGEVSIKDDFFISDDEVIVPSSQEDPINASLEEINSLNIIINDCNCREDFINSVCEELDKDGIKFTYTADCKNIDVNGAVVITLDQQYSAGPGTLIFAPLANDRIGNSDALALAAAKAFYEKGFLVDEVACGQMGFRENENGTISERVPTNAEEVIGKDKNTSFVTISFGTQNTHAGLTAASIESMLTRYYSYITNGYGQEDLIYCVEDGESYEDIADKLGTTNIALDSYNDTADETTLLTGEALINPVVKERREFNQHVPTNLYIDKTLWSK